MEQEQHEQSVDHSAEIAALQEEGLFCRGCKQQKCRVFEKFSSV